MELLQNILVTTGVEFCRELLESIWILLNGVCKSLDSPPFTLDSLPLKNWMEEFTRVLIGFSQINLAPVLVRADSWTPLGQKIQACRNLRLSSEQHLVLTSVCTNMQIPVFVKHLQSSRTNYILYRFTLRGYCTPGQFSDCLFIFLKYCNTLVTSKICFL